MEGPAGRVVGLGKRKEGLPSVGNEVLWTSGRLASTCLLCLPLGCVVLPPWLTSLVLHGEASRPLQDLCTSQLDGRPFLFLLLLLGHHWQELGGRGRGVPQPPCAVLASKRLPAASSMRAAQGPCFPAVAPQRPASRSHRADEGPGQLRSVLHAAPKPGGAADAKR